MKASENPVIGRWRIVEADLWDRDHLDLCGPATLVIRPAGDGEITFGAMQASLDVDYGPDEIGFTWAGSDEGTKVSGAGSAELQDDAPSILTSSTTSVTRPSSKPCGTLLQQPARAEPFRLHRSPLR